MLLRVYVGNNEVFNSSVKTLSAQTTSGWVGIWPGHSPTVYILEKGHVVVDFGGRIEDIKIDGGVLEVNDEGLVIRTKNLDVSRFLGNLA